MSDDGAQQPTVTSTATHAPSNGKEPIEPVVMLLFAGTVVFAALLLCCEKFFPNDGQVFQVFAGLVTGFGGAFFMRVKPKESSDKVVSKIEGGNSNG